MGDSLKWAIDMLVLAIAVGALAFWFILSWKITAAKPGLAPMASFIPETLPLSDMSYAGLSASKITIQHRLGAEFLELKLHNQEGSLLFDHLLPGPKNQLRIEAMLPNRQPLQSGMVVGQGESILIEMYGSFVVSKSFQFRLLMHDLAGQKVQVEIVGLGVVSPLIRKVELVPS